MTPLMKVRRGKTVVGWLLLLNLFHVSHETTSSNDQAGFGSKRGTLRPQNYQRNRWSATISGILFHRFTSR